VAAVTVFYFVRKDWKFSLSKLNSDLFVYLLILLLLVWQVNLLIYLLFPQQQCLLSIVETRMPGILGHSIDLSD